MATAPQPRRAQRVDLRDAEDAYEPVVPFGRPAPRGDGRVHDLPARRRPQAVASSSLEGDQERPTPRAERRPRRRRPPRTWLQRNALNVMAVSVVVAVLGLGFGLAQVLARGDSRGSAAPPVVGASPAAASLSATGAPAASGPAMSSLPAQTPPTLPPTLPSVRNVQASVRALEANYTVEQGDSLVAIAARFKTTVQRVQALNNLSDPGVLNIGQKLVIPPPL